MSNFLWGTATSSHQIEGYNEHNDWWAWEAEGNIEGGARSGAATDHWNRFREDLALAADLGINSYRFSIEWSRIEPQEGVWNQSAIDWYSDLISECEKRGMKPMLTLHHFTSPLWFAKQGGFASEDASEKFGRFVTKIAETLGPRVPLWCTLNEPVVLTVGGYLGRFMPPAQFSKELAMRASVGLFKSHLKAYEILHSKIKNRAGPWKDDPLEVGIAHNCLDFMPDRKWHPLENVIARLLRGFYNDSWLDAVVGRKQHFGVPFLVKGPPQVAEGLGKKSVDFIGVNYYTKCYAKWRPKDAGQSISSDLPLGLSFARRKEVVSDLDWAIHPKGFRKVLRKVAAYGLPIYITENGIADRDDRLRPAYIQSHLMELAYAIKSGIDIRGYYHWSLLDNFEWIKGFGPRFGLFKVDYETFDRTPTASARYYKKIIQSHQGLPDQIPSQEVLSKTTTQAHP